MRLPALLAACLIAIPALAQVQKPNDDLIFQTALPWSPRVNLPAGTVMVYGINNDLPSRIQSWRDHGYRVAVMTGVAWGQYGDYLRGDYDGHEHWNETQQEASGKLILHGGREVPYVAPSITYGDYLSRGIGRALDAGAEAIYLEEPEFWARAGWSDSFKKEWRDYYHEDWQAPDSSPDAQYRASKLKYFLYRRALAQVFSFVKQYGEAHHRTIPCYVATHSLINYAQWRIVSPESSLMQVGADGYIAQVWTGTSRTPNVYEGNKQQRTFATAFLEYGAMQNLVRTSGRRMWFLNDPIEDNPNHSWSDYTANWESTLTASLLQPEIASYEMLPWPDRIFGLHALYPTSEPSTANPHPEKAAISPAYEIELQTVFHALQEMHQPAHWLVAGTRGIGVLVSDTLMFQRATPQPSDENLGSFYSLALPLLMRGMPVEPVQIENSYSIGAAPAKQTPAAFLRNYKLLLLTYEGQKPPNPAFHAALADWVRKGGALVVVDDDKDPYNSAKDWWNSGANHDATPRLDLFRTLGLDAHAEGLHHVGRGVVYYAAKSPAALSYDKSGADTIRTISHQAADAIHLPWTEAPALVLERGPYVVAAGLDKSNSTFTTVPGRFLNLFDANLSEINGFSLKPDTRALLRRVPSQEQSAIAATILAASAKTTSIIITPHKVEFTLSGIEARDSKDQSIVAISLPRAPAEVRFNEAPLASANFTYADDLLRLHLPASAQPQKVQIRF